MNLPPGAVQVKRAATVASHKMPDTSHNSNPFVHAPNVNPILGTGSDISAPRPGGPIKLASHHKLPPVSTAATRPKASGRSPLSPSMASYQAVSSNSAQMFPSRTSSAMSTSTQNGAASSTGFFGAESHVLPFPLAEPNSYMPPELQQSSDPVNTLFNIADQGKLKRLGSGGGAVVFGAQHKVSHKWFAIKKLMLLKDEHPDHFYKRSSKEFLIAQGLSGHKHIVGTYSLLKVQTSTTVQRGWAIVMQFCRQGDLYDYCRSPHYKNIGLTEKFCFFKQAACAVRFLHSCGIAHRDLKPENILIDDNGCLKITDFGIADYAHEDPNDLSSAQKVCTTFVGSPPYVSPEAMELKDRSKKGSYLMFDQDSWALGMIFFVVVHGQQPFTSATPSEAHYRDWISSFTSYCNSQPGFRTSSKYGPGSEYKWARDFHSSDAARVAWRLLDPQISSRYKMDDLFADPWFKDVDCCIDETHCDDSKNYMMIAASIFAKEENSSSSSAAPSPLVKPKSMLDMDMLCAKNVLSSTPNGNDCSTACCEPITIGKSLPPLEEVDHESMPNSPVTQLMRSLVCASIEETAEEHDESKEDHADPHKEHTKEEESDKGDIKLEDSGMLPPRGPETPLEATIAVSSKPEIEFILNHNPFGSTTETFQLEHHGYGEHSPSHPGTARAASFSSLASRGSARELRTPSGSGTSPPPIRRKKHNHLP